MKQKTAIRLMIDYLKDDIKKYEEFNNGEMNVTARLALQKAQELESVNEQQIIDAVNSQSIVWGNIKPADVVWTNQDIDIPLSASLKYSGEQYFNETFEKP